MNVGASTVVYTAAQFHSDNAHQWIVEVDWHAGGIFSPTFSVQALRFNVQISSVLLTR